MVENHGKYRDSRMRLDFKNRHLSIKSLPSFELPNFAVLIGRNGVGKTQLLDAVKDGNISVAGIPTQEIEKYDMDSFQTRQAGSASWGDGFFVQHTAEAYFSGKRSLSLVDVARDIFEETLKNFSLTEGSEDYLTFEAGLRESIRKMLPFGPFPALNTTQALSSYTKKIYSTVIQPLQLNVQGRQESRSVSCENNPARLVCLAMKLSEKLPHELERGDLLRAANYEGNTLQNTLSELFIRYKVAQYSSAHTEGEQSQESFDHLMAKYRREVQPPWEVLREYLDLMREATGTPDLFNFSFTDPEKDQITFSDHHQYSFETRMTNRTTGESYSIEHLSSGEKILMSLCLASFNQAIGRRQPKLILLDEIDAVLHPSMIKAMIATLKKRFVDNGTRVIMATHSVTTVALLEDGEIYRVVRKSNGIEVHPLTQADAVSELSEGLANIDTGLRIATLDVTPITILTEGKNTLHLKKWVNIFFPEQVSVFEGLENRTGKVQLKTYGELLSKMQTNSHILVVWDCDAEQDAKELSKELAGGNHVTAFSFSKRDNKIASEGIENKYEEKVLEPFAVSITDCSTGGEIRRSFHSQKKKQFAEFIFANGTREHFQHFQDLEEAVQEILAREPQS